MGRRKPEVACPNLLCVRSTGDQLRHLIFWQTQAGKCSSLITSSWFVANLPDFSQLVACNCSCCWAWWTLDRAFSLVWAKRSRLRDIQWIRSQGEFFQVRSSIYLCTNDLHRNGLEVYTFLRVDCRRWGIKDSRDLGFDAFCLVEG